MTAVWKDYVRTGLRQQEVLDLFDYNDFHWNRDVLFEHLNRSIVEGRYEPSKSLAVRLEKRLGVSRTIVTPIPDDAVVLQCIVEAILPKALKVQPSRNAFFSRSHSSADAEFTFGKDYIWFKQWPKFFNKRISISSTHKFVVTTDISTYFDNIDHDHLRNIISTLDGIDEVVLDLMFSVIDRISWSPDYLPSVGVGLPQVNFDAPRLLSHIYLFEADAFLKKETGGHFVRWVDDITFAVDTEGEGKRILRDLDALLQLRGVRLNSGKTRVLSAKAARRFFCGTENEYLDKMKARIASSQATGRSTNGLAKQLATRFDKFVAAPTDGHHDKVCKRYLGLFATLRSDHAVSWSIAAFAAQPGLRETVYRYFLDVGPTDKVVRAIKAYLTGHDALDDVSLFQVARLICSWEVSPGTALFRNLRALGTALCGVDYVERNAFFFVAGLWITSKYGTQTMLRKILVDTESLWSNSEFLSRQVAAATGKFRSTSVLKWVQNKIERHGFRSAVSVIASLRELQSFDTTVPPHVRLYVLNGMQPSLYSIQRFLVLFQVLNSKLLPATEKARLKADALRYVTDPHYRDVIQKV